MCQIVASLEVKFLAIECIILDERLGSEQSGFRIGILQFRNSTLAKQSSWKTIAILGIVVALT